MHKTLTGGFEK